MAYYILGPIRNVFLSLHQASDSAPTLFSASTRDWDNILSRPSLYPVCKVPDHHSDSTPHTHDDAASMALAGANPHTRPHDPNNTALIPSVTRLDQRLSSTHAPLPVFTNALPLRNQLSIPISTQVIGQTSTEDHHIPTTSLSPVIEPPRTTQASTSSPSPRSNASASQPANNAVGHSALARAPSDDLNVQLSPSPAPVLDVTLPTGLLSFQAATLSNLACSSLDPHSSIPATAAEGQGNIKAGTGMEEDASHSTLRVREEITSSADIPPDLEHRPLDPTSTHSPYDIV